MNYIKCLPFLQAWTNIRSENVGKPSLVTYRGIRLKFIGPAPGCCGLIYSTSIKPVWIGNHSITFRTRERFRKNWSWTDTNNPAHVHIEVPQDPQVCRVCGPHVCLSVIWPIITACAAALCSVKDGFSSKGKTLIFDCSPDT